METVLQLLFIAICIALGNIVASLQDYRKK